MTAQKILKELIRLIDCLQVSIPFGKVRPYGFNHEEETGTVPVLLGRREAEVMCF